MKEKIDVQKPDDLGLDISDLRYFLVMLLFSAVVFFLLISQRLTNELGRDFQFLHPEVLQP